uniref:WH2 domain-containing protein n=1 Tax=Strongyloides papillosus TaxID=174720 RepID=A0A0N5CIX8_STREA
MPPNSNTNGQDKELMELKVHNAAKRWQKAKTGVLAQKRLGNSINGTALGPLNSIGNQVSNGPYSIGSLKRKPSLGNIGSSIKRKPDVENMPPNSNTNGQGSGTGSSSLNPGNTRNSLSNNRRNSSASLLKHRGSIRPGRRPSFIGNGGSFRRPMFPGRRSSLFRRNSIG